MGYRPAAPGAVQGGSAGSSGSASLPTELRRAALLLQDLQLGGVPPWWLCFEHPGEPIPKARPRAAVGKNGRLFFYSPKDTRDAERALGERFRFELGRKNVSVPLLGPLALVVFFYRTNLRQVDEDNLRKLVLDATTRAGVWRDDSQVTAGAQAIFLDRDRPRTLIALCPHDSNMIRAGRRKRRR